MNFNPFKLGKLIGKNFNSEIPHFEKVKEYCLEAGEKGFSLEKYNIKANRVRQINQNKEISEIEISNNNFFIPFGGLNSKVFHVDLDGGNYEEIAEEIKQNMTNIESNLISTLRKNSENKAKIYLIRRKISPEIAELLGLEIDSAQRALIVNPTTTAKLVGGFDKLHYALYCYESIIIIAIDNIMNPNNKNQKGG